MVQRDFEGFQRLFSKFINVTGPSVIWDKIERLPKDAIKEYTELPVETDKNSVREMLNSLVVIKLNGGLGTSMGCRNNSHNIFKFVPF